MNANTQSLNELVDNLVEQKMLTQKEKDEILGNPEKGIEATGKVTIESRTIIFKNMIKIGDYIDYNPTVEDLYGTKIDTESLTYVSPVGTIPDNEKGIITHGNGNSEQTFIATADVKWRVLDVDDTTGKIELISEHPIKTTAGTTFVFEGGIGYLYIEQELSEACKIFGYGYGADRNTGITYTIGGPMDTPIKKTIAGTGARSVTIEDINKKAGITEADFNKLHSNYGDTSEPTTPVYYPKLNGTSKESPGQGKEGDKATNFFYSYFNYNKTKIEDTNTRDMLFNGNYWLASRCIGTHSDYADFYTRYVNTNVVGASSLCNGNTPSLHSSISDNYAIRPVVTLEADIELEKNPQVENSWIIK